MTLCSMKRLAPASTHAFRALEDCNRVQHSAPRSPASRSYLLLATAWAANAQARTSEPTPRPDEAAARLLKPAPALLTQ